MAEEFQAAGICSGNNWWNSSRSLSLLPTVLSPYSLSINNDLGFFSPCQIDHHHHHSLKVARSCAEESNLVSENMVFQDVNTSSSDGSGGSSMNYSNLEMMGYGLSSSNPSLNWVHDNNTNNNNNPTLLSGGRRRTTDSNVHISMVEEIMGTTLMEENHSISNDHHDSQIQRDWDNLKNQVSLSPMDNSHQQFPLALSSTSSYGSFLKSLFDSDLESQQLSIFGNNQSSNYSSTAAATATATSNSSIVDWSRFPSLLKTSVQKQELQDSGLHFYNNTPYWNASAPASAAAALNDIRSNVFNSSASSSESQFVLMNEGKPNCTIAKSKIEEVLEETGSVLKTNTACEPAFKRPRIETPSPLPTFKVRKEKLGDRITALQQLVSPFGKTDTASVLHEAIDYIKFLHAQVNNLSTPYMKNGIPSQHQPGTIEIVKEKQELKDLRSRGLCLVPINSSTFPVNETTSDFWSPSFGSTFR